MNNPIAGDVSSLIGGKPHWKFEVDISGGQGTLVAFWIDLDKTPDGPDMKTKIQKAKRDETAVVITWKPGQPREAIKVYVPLSAD